MDNKEPKRRSSDNRPSSDFYVNMFVIVVGICAWTYLIYRIATL